MVILTSFEPPTEGIRHTEINTQAVINTTQYGNGTLYIAESRVSWVGETGRGFSLEYPSISLHAISRDLSAFPQECLYLMLDGDIGGEDSNLNNGSSSGNEDDEDPITTTDVRFVPQSKENLEALFSAMSECQVLHPDENESEDSESEFYGDIEGGDHLTPQGIATLEHLENIFDDGNQRPGQAGDGAQNGDNEPMETGQFEDADQ